MFKFRKYFINVNYMINVNLDEPNNITEEHYLELSTHFKTLIDDKYEEIQELKSELTHNNFLLCKIYGIVSVVSDLFDNMNINNNISTTIEYNLDYIIEQLKENIE